MAEKSASFKLRMAKSYVDDAAAGRVSGASAIESLDKAIVLAREANRLEPGSRLDDGTTPEGMAAGTYFLLGMAYRDRASAQAPGRGYPLDWYNAQECFEESYKLAPTQDKLLYIATCMIGAMRANRASATNFRKFGGGTIYYHPLIRAKQAKEYAREFLERVIAVDPNSEAAVEAGKVLMELK